MNGFSTTPRAREAARAGSARSRSTTTMWMSLFSRAKPPAELKVRSIDSRRFSVRGSIPAGHHRLVRIHEVDDPASFARALFIEALRHRNVRIDATFLG